MRFSLRSIFVVVTAAAMALGIALYATKDYRERMALRRELLSNGAQFASVDVDRSIGLLFVKPITSNEFKKHKEIERIELQGFAVTEGSLMNLAGLESVRLLLFQSCTITQAQELAPLSEIGTLRSLLFWNTPIDDSFIDTIATLPGLESVDFHNTKVTEAGVNRLRSARPKVKVTNRP
jgi:hypothetical protein